MRRIAAVLVFFAGLSASSVQAASDVTFAAAGPGPNPFGPIGVFTVSGVADKLPLTGEDMIAFAEAQAANVEQDEGKSAKSLLYRIYKDASQVGQIDFTENMLLRLLDGDTAFTFTGFGVDPATLSMDIFLLQPGNTFDKDTEQKAVMRLKDYLFRETAVTQTIKQLRVMTVVVDGATDILQHHVRVIETSRTGVVERIEEF